MKKRIWKRPLALLLALALAVPVSAAEATAATVQLMKAEGSVTVTNKRGKEQKIRENMRLYSGSHVETGEASYAWLDLDASKLTKLDAASELELRKSGKELELLLNAGNLYFNVTSPLEEDESLNIRTSTMMAGIRGTSGWVQVLDQYHTRVYVLQGRVECSVTDPLSGQTKTTVLLGGDTAEFVVYDPEKAGDKCDIIRKRYSEEEARGFTLVELAPDAPHREKIRDDSGLDFSDDMDAARDRLAQDEAETHNKLLPIRYDYNNQDHEVSHDPVWPENVPDPSDERDDDDDSETTYEPPEEEKPSGVVTMTMQVPDEDVDAALARPEVTGVRLVPAPAGMDSTLHIDDGITVPAGKTLTLDAGVDALVYPNISLQVDGTMTLQSDDLVNNGTITVNSANTLRVGGNLVNNGTLVITDVGRVVVDGTFSSSTVLGLGQTAQALAKTFASDIRLPQNWSVSAATDAQGYYSLVYTATYNITISGTVQEEVSGTPVANATVKVTQKGVELGTATSAADGSYSIDVAVTSDAPYELVFTASGYKELSVQQTATSSGNVTYDAELSPTTMKFILSEDGKRLTIYGSAAMDDYSTTSKAPWISDADPNIPETVEIRNGVTSIGNNAFNGCTGLTSITIPDSVTSIGIRAFESCSSLTSVTIPDGVTSISNSAFEYCSSLTSVTIPNSVTSIDGYAFEYCTSLTSITIPGSVTRIGDSAFFNCSSMTSVTISDGVTSIDGGAFSHCTSLTSVTIPNSVTSIGNYAFYDCSSLTSITIPNSVTSIGSGTFAQCTSLASITIPNSVTSIGGEAFRYCSSLTSINIPDSVTSIGSNAFADSGLTSVTIPGSATFPSGDGREFLNCTDLTTVYISPGVTNIHLYMFSGCTALTDIYIPDTVTSIEYAAFIGCTSLRNVHYAGDQTRWDAIAIDAGENAKLTDAAKRWNATW